MGSSAERTPRSPPLVRDEILSGRFRLAHRLARGGVGTVWLAHDERLDRDVALKILPTSEQSAGADRFHAEALASAQVDHHNVVRLYDVCTAGAFTVLVMEFVDGPDLRSRMTGPLAAPVVAGIGIQLAEALASAHERQVVHRDVKPENVLLDRHGIVKLADFGVAKLLHGDEEQAISGSLVGSPAYVAPEQLEGGPVDGRTDLYALGVLLWECATGARPFAGDSSAAILYSRVVRDLPDLTGLVDAVPTELAWAVRRATRRDPADRFGTAYELAAALRPLALRPQQVVEPLWSPAPSIDVPAAAH